MNEETRLSEATRETLRQFLLALIHREAEFSPKPELEKVLNDFELFLSKPSALIRTGILALLKALEMSTLAQGYRHTFSKLSPDEQKEYLNKLERSKSYAFRGLIMGIKTIMLIIYFSQPEAEKAVGYDGKCYKESSVPAKSSPKGENIVPEDFFYH